MRLDAQNDYNSSRLEYGVAYDETIAVTLIDGPAGRLSIEVWVTHLFGFSSRFMEDFGQKCVNRMASTDGVRFRKQRTQVVLEVNP